MKHQAIQIPSQDEIRVTGQRKRYRVVSAWICSRWEKMSYAAIEEGNVKRGPELGVEGHGEEVICGRERHERLTDRLNEHDHNDLGGDDLAYCEG